MGAIGFNLSESRIESTATRVALRANPSCRIWEALEVKSLLVNLTRVKNGEQKIAYLAFFVKNSIENHNPTPLAITAFCERRVAKLKYERNLEKE